ncbi:L-type lectin-domain containing receptor kinase S.4-like [Cryptomeria japonica]|uniref:L-type lectin-domain containing receptor kinase S.4-like n=1 Tax=Cryptomeria japonica TaxID=3369 RepID=UPI0027DA2D15|nr:L-type lectin-domain containing receptor kinase S.4-like [Cryptomeria japonica]
MAEVCHAASSLLFSCVAASLILMSHAGNLSFAFPPSNDFKTQNDAYFQGDNLILLTKNQATGSLANSSGWAAYNKSIPLWDNLILLLSSEFDTYNNSALDPDDNHVGVDVNSFFSKVNVSLTSVGKSGLCDKKLKSGKHWEAWVDYDGGAKRLQVCLFCNHNGISISKRRTPILIYDIDLRDFLPENIKVGLSASTGLSSETHTVCAWDFSCNYSWESSAVQFPINPPNENNSSFGNGKINNSHFRVKLIVVFCSALAICGFIFIGWRQYFRKSECGGEARPSKNLLFGAQYSDSGKLGQGGFGGVYRGILPGTKEMVAVKKISQWSNQGRKEYVSKVTIISRLRHRNLVKLLGWCHRKGELLLVYEYLPNGSLDNYIFGEQKGALDWDRRYDIACDLASALVYLHEEWEQLVVHRDIKASKVMLDSNFNAKLGDFGLARLVERHHSACHTTLVAGTLGYLAPECVMTGKASPETDVFSFGAVTLEIACGRQPVDRSLHEQNCRLVEWVWNLYGHGNILCAADEKLGGKFNEKEM